MAAAANSDDGRDQAFCITSILRRWGLSDTYLSPTVVFAAFHANDRSDLSDAEFDLLEALYERRWNASSDASRLWLILTRLLLERGDADRAAQVAVLIDAPDDIIELRADRRFRAVLKSRFVIANPEAAARQRLKRLQDALQSSPRSLLAFSRTVSAMADLHMDSQVLAQIADVERRIQDSPANFDDAPDRYNWILDLKARVLHRTGRFDEAVIALDRAAHLPDRRDLASPALNLADLLADLGRPDDALAILPSSENLSSTGKLVLCSIQVKIAAQKSDQQLLKASLDILRRYRDTNSGVLEDSLIYAGLRDEARQVLLWRLNDSTSRSRALREMQHYSEPARTAMEAQWHDVYVSLAADPEVKALVGKMGNIDRYLWHYNRYD